jgi:hypothetical protein
MNIRVTTLVRMWTGNVQCREDFSASKRLFTNEMRSDVLKSRLNCRYFGDLDFSEVTSKCAQSAHMSL